MADVQAKCTNFGNCGIADRREMLNEPDGSAMTCPECGQSLQSVPGGGGGGRNLIPFFALGAVAIVAGLFLLPNLFRGPETGTTTGGAGTTAGATSGTTATGGTTTTGNAPANGNGPVTPQEGVPVLTSQIFMLYEKSLQKWMEKAVVEVNRKSEGKGSIRVDYRGSRDGFREILDGKAQPIIWNPADVYWPQKLTAAWSDPRLRTAKYQSEGAEILAPSTQEVIASTYLVMVMRPDRARIFEAAMKKPEYSGKTWKLLRNIAVNGWASVEGPAKWGKLKLIHTNPILSNSGTVSLALMFAEYRNDGNPNATPESPGFLSFMSDIERSMSGTAPETTSNVMKAFLDSGASAPDVAICYEVNAVDKINDGERLQIVYPTPTMRVQFPARILKASWVDSAQEADAQAFLNYLYSPAVQEQLVAIGFRSARNDLRSVEDNVLNTASLRGAGFLLTGLSSIERPATVPEIDGLQAQWDSRF